MRTDSATRFSSAAPARVFILFTVLLSSLLVSAQGITGVVTNGTTGKPAIGDEVALVDPMQGMAELGNVKSDAQGRYSLTPSAPAAGPRLVRVTHDGINYFTFAPPGTKTLNVNVYDSARKLDGVSGTARVMKMQTSPDGGTLQVMELYAVTNASQPPRTQVAEKSFEIALPEAAVVDSADAQGPNGQPLPTQPSPVPGKKGQYTFDFALKPGETRFQVAYHMPYSGSANISAHMTRGYEHFVLVLPLTMQWQAKTPAMFSPMNDKSGTNVEVARKVNAGDNVEFKISGTGTVIDEQANAGAPGGGAPGGGAMGPGGGGSGRDSGPGGGLGAPIDAPDALEKSRWVILFMLTVILAGGAFLTVSRARMRHPAIASAVAPIPSPSAFARSAASAPIEYVPAVKSNPLLDAMKDELFQLELDRQKGLVSDAEYKKLKSALDQTLARALSREKRS